MDRPLTLGERLQWRTHLLICRGCRAYRRQLAILRQALRTLEQHPLDEAGATLSDAARDRIRQTLAKW
jgi:hypothetical protein